MALGGNFPVGRFKLAIADPLFGDLIYFNLDKPVVSVGLREGECVLPFAEKGLSHLLAAMPESIVGRPLFKLCHDAHHGRWSAEFTHEGPQRSNAESFAVPDINGGDFFEAHLPESWGSFRFKLVDVLKMAHVVGAEEEQKRAPAGLDPITKLSMLPPRPLRIIAGHLELGSPDFMRLLDADPLVIPKLKGSVRWRVLDNFYWFSWPILDTFRTLRVLSKDHLEKLNAGIPLRKCLMATHQLQAVSGPLLQEVAVLLAGPMLKEVTFPFDQLDLFRQPNNATKKIHVIAKLAPGSMPVVWSKLALLPLSHSTEIALKLEVGYEDPRLDHGLFSELASPLSNVTELSWAVSMECPVPPFEKLPKLKKLSVEFQSVDENYLRLMNSSLSEANLVNLKEVSVKRCAWWMKPTLDAVVKAAPYIEKLVWVEEIGYDFRNRRRGVGRPDVFGNLKSVKSLGSLTRFSFFIRSRNVRVEEVLQFFLDFKHLKMTHLGSVSSKEPTSKFLEKFRELKEMGKAVEARVDLRFGYDSECECCYCHPQGWNSDDSFSHINAQMLRDDYRTSRCGCCRANYFIVVRDPATKEPDEFEGKVEYW